jgi:parvulin-like peptidyl-prolyl isomerase
MTFRARPVTPNRPSRPAHHGDSRRNTYLNIGFGVAVALSVVILVGVAFFSWYREHLAPAASVDGQTITRDEFREAAEIEIWRIQQEVGRVNAALAAGRLTNAQASARIQSLNSQGSGEQLAQQVTEQLIDTRIQGRLATEEGITVTPEQVDARIAEEKTSPEERHAWLIAVQPEIDDDAEEPTSAQKAAAKEIADKALADITSGSKTWEEVAKAVSTDSTKTSGGDLGWITEEATEDEAYLEAVFAAEVDEPTDVIETEDGTYMIGRVTEIAPETVDQAWEQKLIDAGLKLETYRAIVTAEVVREQLEDKIVADALASTEQRHVLEIAIQAPQTEPSDAAVKVRHILYSPRDDAQGAAEVPPDDPAWTEAQLAAQKAYDELTKDPSKFDERARDESDEASAQGETGSGGKLPYVDNDGQFVPEFADAVLKEGLEPGQILEPVKTDFGWHVIQIMYRPPDIAQMEKLKAEAEAGADFEQLARDYSDGNEAGKGGDRGWVAEGMLDVRQLRAVFDAPVGGLSDIVEIEGGGTFLYKVLEERTQAPDEDQKLIIESRAFQNWYGEKKDAVTITRDLLAEAGVAG